jgi:hypothetical protein
VPRSARRRHTPIYRSGSDTPFTRCRRPCLKCQKKFLDTVAPWRERASNWCTIARFTNPLRCLGNRACPPAIEDDQFGVCAGHNGVHAWDLRQSLALRIDRGIQPVSSASAMRGVRRRRCNSARRSSDERAKVVSYACAPALRGSRAARSRSSADGGDLVSSAIEAAHGTKQVRDFFGTHPCTSVHSRGG